MATKNQLNLKHSQKLQLSRQLQQMISLLNLSTLELAHTINDMLQENPLLERIEPSDRPSEPEKITAALSQSTGGNNYIEEDIFANLPEQKDIYQHLHDQVCEWVNDERQAKLLHILIDSLDEHGFLSSTLEDIIEHTPLEWMLETEELSEALALLHRFDPAGVGANDAQHSLILQLQRLPENDCRNLAIIIMEDHFHHLARANAIGIIKKEVRQNEDDIQAAIDLIKTLRPYPCSGMAMGESANFVKADVRVHKENGQWIVQSEPHLLPSLQVSPDYAQAVSESQDSVWKGKLTEAKQFLQNLQLRENTILQIARVIVEKQQDFFDFGQAALQPLQHNDVAEWLDIHPSTVSRSVRQKYLICPQGLFELNAFFSQAVGQDQKDAMSAKAVKACLKDWLSAENPQQPHTDEDLQRKLQTVGMKLARRTVAKYREELGFPSIYHRKKKYQQTIKNS